MDHDETDRSRRSAPAGAATGALGLNAWLVEEMYQAYRADPASVSESWREFFADYRSMLPGVQGREPAPIRSSLEAPLTGAAPADGPSAAPGEPVAAPPSPAPPPAPGQAAPGAPA
ncbi:MAG: hypothetical protein M0Z33_04680, partial [Actinomycetota bacterium]|nr:hypothetical protein [Actinomycetota bacterium]